MARFSCSLLSSNSIAIIDGVSVELWNPHATISLYVAQVSAFTTAATLLNVGLARSTTIGTSSATVTPDADNHSERGFAPVSGAVLKTGFSVEPTVQIPRLRQSGVPGVIGSGGSWEFDEAIEVPAGTGLCIVALLAALVPVSQVQFVWEE